METNLQGMETWVTINPKQDGFGMISLIRDVKHRRDETAQAVLDFSEQTKS